MDTTGLRRDGFCNCGCGGRTSIADQSDTRLGHVKGEPTYFLAGHSRHVGWHNFAKAVAETDTGYETPCLLWQKRVTRKGYAFWGETGGRDQYVHRAVYEHAHGPLPQGWTVHHRCRVRHCVRLDHLEALPTYAHEQAQLAARMQDSGEQAAYLRGYRDGLAARRGGDLHPDDRLCRPAPNSSATAPSAERTR